MFELLQNLMGIDLGPRLDRVKGGESHVWGELAHFSPHPGKFLTEVLCRVRNTKFSPHLFKGSPNR